MGLFIERKNPIFLLDVLSNLCKTRSDLVIIFWGKGPLELRMFTVLIEAQSFLDIISSIIS